MLDILERAGMRDCKPCSTPVDTHSKLPANGVVVADPTHCRSIAGALQYLTFTRLDIAYAVQQVCLYMHDPWEPHLGAMKRILQYLQGTLDLGLLLHRTSPTNLTIYIGLCGVPQGQSHLLVVVQTSAYSVTVQ
jgi:hypothetical protein